MLVLYLPGDLLYFFKEVYRDALNREGFGYDFLRYVDCFFVRWRIGLPRAIRMHGGNLDLAFILFSWIGIMVSACVAVVSSDSVEPEMSQNWQSWLFCTDPRKYLCTVFQSFQIQDPDWGTSAFALFCGCLESCKVTGFRFNA